MIGAAVPVRVDGPTIKLFPGFSRSLAVSGPARLSQNILAEQLVFDAGRSIRQIDLFRLFWRDEAIEMDWLEDFLCNPDMERFIQTLLNPPPEEEEAEELYSKRDLSTLGSDVVDDV